MKPDPFQQAATDAARHAIDQLQDILNQAQGYFITGNHRAAWGTLALFDEAAEDLRAACRIYRAAL